MEVVIQEYTAADRDRAKAVVLRGFKDFGFKYTPEYDYDLDDPQKHYIDQGGMFYILKVDKKIVGTIAIINKGRIGELKRLYVDKEYQGKGFGSLLFDKAMQFCKNKGFTKVEFETNKKFTKAHLLYQRRGFKTVREDERSYYMEKDL